jgi:hypothetical protein
MPIANVDLTNSLEYFRMITNQCIVAFNYMTSNTYSVSRLTVNPTPSTGFVSVNVANGLIYGNGSGIFSYTNAAITGTFRNSQLQNSSMTFANGAGVFVGTVTASLNTGTITLVSNPVDSLTNTSPFLPAAANAIPRLIAAVGTVTKTQGRFFQNVGGTGVVSHSNGRIAISNGVSGQLEFAAPLGLSGMISSPLGGFVGLTANLISLGNIAFTSTGNSGITVSQNVYPDATTSTIGVIKIRDSVSGRAVTTEGASANSLNAVSNIVAVGASSGLINASGRLILSNTYEFTWSSGTDANNIWGGGIANIQTLSHIVVTVVGRGGGSTSANNNNSASVYVMGNGGGSAAAMKAIITRDQLINFRDINGAGFLTVRKFGAGVSTGDGGNGGNPSPGENGGDGQNCQIGIANGANPGYILFVEGGPGAQYLRALSNTGFCANSSAYRVPKAWANSQAATVIQKSAGRPGYPGMVVQRGLANGAGPFHVVGWGGWPARVSGEFVSSYVNSTRYLYDIAGYDGLVSSTSAGSGLGKKNEDGLTSVTDYGCGASASISANVGDYDHKGSNGGEAYIRIEAYVNA